MCRRDRLMSIHLFFNVITVFVNAQFIALSKFLNACEIEEFSVLTAPSTTLRLHTWAHHRSKISVHGGVASNFETDGNHSVPGQENMVGDVLWIFPVCLTGKTYNGGLVCLVLQTFVFWGLSLETGKDPGKGGIWYVGVWHYYSTYTIEPIDVT